MVRAPARNVFCNLVTVNYLLAGLQRLQRSDRNNWSDLAENMCYDYSSACDDESVQMQEMLKMLSTCVCVCVCVRESILFKRETEHLYQRPLIHGIGRDPFARE